ncbi:MAG TPA: sigma-70 family RNA polymerase sigma factor [Hyphomonadaceae bacterium]|jgi:RNA polymerase sigma factor for flagellar operon FliA|nr:sigma-70 family RNA polymerase sigma factor [Hyphomonadaceae bacterium]
MKASRHSVGLALVERQREVEASLWRRLRYENDVPSRELLFERYQSLARRIALSELHRRPGYGLDRTDFLQLAYGGLLEAIDRFDPLHGAPFSAYARRRIRGAISDGLAKSSEGAAQYSHARKLETERLRSLDDPSAARSDGDAIAQLSDMAVALALGFMIESSKHAAGARNLEELCAYESVNWREAELSVLQEVEQLPEVEQTILKQHYLQEMSFKDIASVLRLSKGRVSQLHRAALERLRTRIRSQL